MGKTVEQGGRHLGIAEDGHPFSERQVGGDEQAGLLVKLADQVEQQCAARGRKRQVAQLIQNHGIDQRELFGQIPGFAQLLFFLQQVDQVHGIEELQACLKAEETLQRQRSQFDAQALETWLSQLQPKLEALLCGNIEEARKVLRALLVEPLTIKPILGCDGQVSSFLGVSYAVTGTTAFGTTFSLANTKNNGVVSEEESERLAGAKKNGTKGENKALEYEITGASTLGALVDYASYIKMASPRGFVGGDGFFQTKETRIVVQ